MTNKNISLKKKHQPFFHCKPKVFWFGSVYCESRHWKRWPHLLQPLWFQESDVGTRWWWRMVFINKKNERTVYTLYKIIPLERGGGRTWTLYHWYVCNVCIIRILDRDYSTSCYTIGNKESMQPRNTRPLLDTENQLRLPITGWVPWLWSFHLLYFHKVGYAKPPRLPLCDI